MVDDQDQQHTDDAQAGTDAPAQTAPRRRRRAASRPAGPPVIPDSDQVELFSAPDPGGQSAAADVAPAPDVTPEAEGELAEAEARRGGGRVRRRDGCRRRPG